MNKAIFTKDEDDELISARRYANHSISEGFSAPEDWEGLTTKEFIDKARYDGKKGDYYANEKGDD